MHSPAWTYEAELIITGPMPGKYKFNDSWLSIDPYKNLLLKVPADVHLAKCTICKKNIKLDTVGESALWRTSTGNEESSKR